MPSNVLPRTFLAAIASTALLLCSACSSALASGPVASTPNAAQPATTYFVDILYLQDGKTPADAKAYFGNIEPVVATHGLRRVGPAYVITQKMGGDIEPDLVNVWTVSSPENTFSDIFDDENYLQHVDQRNATFDMPRSHMFLLQAAK